MCCVKYNYKFTNNSFFHTDLNPVHKYTYIRLYIIIVEIIIKNALIIKGQVKALRLFDDDRDKTCFNVSYLVSNLYGK